MNEAYENKRRELIKSMDMSASQTMFEMHQAMSAEWATALGDKIDSLAEMGNNGVSLFVQLASQLNEFIAVKEKYFKDNFGSFDSATASSPTFMGAMLRSFGNAKNPPEFEAQGVKDSKTQEDYANALKAINMGYKYGSLSIEPDGVFVVFKGLPSNILEVQDMEMPFAPNLVELPVVTGDQFAEEKAPQSAMKSKDALKSWMETQFENNEEALNNAVRSYVKSQGEVGKKLTNEEVMADQQHMEEAKGFYIQQAMGAVKQPSMPEPQATEEGSVVPIEDEEATALSFAGGGKFEFTMKDGGKVPAQIFRDLNDMDGPSRSIFSRFEAKYGAGTARELGMALSKA
jgi:hypothetical protein